MRHNGLANPWKIFLITADDTDVLVNDQILGNLGIGRYAVTCIAAAAADGTITISDGLSDVVSLAAIPVRAAAVTFPEIRKNEDRRWVIDFDGRGPNLPISIVDGTNAEIALLVEFLGGPR